MISQLYFEAENTGGRPISLMPDIVFYGYANEGKKFKCKYQIATGDRSLPLHVPKQFYATSKEDVELPLMWLKKFIFSPTSGFSITSRIRETGGVNMSALQFQWELWNLKRNKVLIPKKRAG
jgi:hypothetical protein